MPAVPRTVFSSWPHILLHASPFLLFPACLCASPTSCGGERVEGRGGRRRRERREKISRTGQSWYRNPASHRLGLLPISSSFSISTSSVLPNWPFSSSTYCRMSASSAIAACVYYRQTLTDSVQYSLPTTGMNPPKMKETLSRHLAATKIGRNKVSVAIWKHVCFLIMVDLYSNRIIPAAADPYRMLFLHEYS